MRTDSNHPSGSPTCATARLRREQDQCPDSIRQPCRLSPPALIRIIAKLCPRFRPLSFPKCGSVDEQWQPQEYADAGQSIARSRAVPRPLRRAACAGRATRRGCRQPGAAQPRVSPHNEARARCTTCSCRNWIKASTISRGAWSSRSKKKRCGAPWEMRLAAQRLCAMAFSCSASANEIQKNRLRCCGRPASKNTSA